ncbi:MAG: peptide MFS transporter [Chitinophagales bacterium]
MDLDIIIIIVGSFFSGLMILFTYLTNKHIQPKQLFLLFFTEMWERFSFYGMRALLILYMTNVLLYKDKDANLMYGAYNAMVYMTPLFGGIIADRILGFRKSIIFGGIMMAIGHLVLAVPLEQSFFLGMGFLIVGCGFFKPNISSFLGRYYTENDSRRDGGYAIFYMGVNVGAFLGSALCGYLGQKVSWHLGFGIAGVFMILGLITFLFNKKTLEGKGESPDSELLDTKVFAGLNWERIIYIGGFISVFIAVIMIQFHDITHNIFILIGIAIVAYILYIASKEAVNQREMLWAALSMIIFSILFWGFYEQAGGSLNLMAERNVNFKVSETNKETFLLANIKSNDTFIVVKDPNIFKVNNTLKIYNDDNKLELNLTVDSFMSDNKIRLKEHIKSDWAQNSKVEKVTTLSSAMVNNSINPFYIIFLTPLFAIMWNWLDRKRLKPNDPVKFGLSFLLLGLGYYIFVLGGKRGAETGYMPLSYFFFGYFFYTCGELFISPIGLSMISKLSPTKIVGFMMGTWFLASGLGHALAGWIGSKMAIPETHPDGSIFSSVESLPIYMNGCSNIALISCIGGIIIIASSFIIKKWMHGVK